MVFRAIKSDQAKTKGVRYCSQPVLEKAKARAFFKAVARRRQQETHSQSHRPSHQRARSRALKAVYAKGELMIFVEIPNIPKNRHTPPSIDKLKPTNKPKRSNRSAKPSKKPRRKPTQSRYKLKTQTNSKGCSETKIKRLKSPQKPPVFPISTDAEHSMTTIGRFLSNRRNPSGVRDCFACANNSPRGLKSSGTEMYAKEKCLKYYKFIDTSN